MSKHTPGPYVVRDMLNINGAEVTELAECGNAQRWKENSWGEPLDNEECAANARRIAAALNACDGISTESLEGGVVADLVAALGEVRPIMDALDSQLASAMGQHKRRNTLYSPILGKIDAAIAKARGEDGA